MEIITRTSSDWPDDAPVEIVERKGAGHPDTLCDAIAERVCIALCRAYRERFGTILHHNVDKVLLCGGASRPRFGGGAIIQPIEIYLGGRATAEWRGVRVPVDELAIDACRDLLAERLPLHHDIRVVSRIRPGSSDLTTLFTRSGVPLANDTSCGVGFAPLTGLERIVLDVERALNDRAVKVEHPELGSDIKVMGVRHRDRIELTIACAFIDRYVESIDGYVAKKSEAQQLAAAVVSRVSSVPPASIAFNAADDANRGDAYLTVTGSSAEAGDDGEVGRGNRVNGLITPYRPMTMEAAAGKNPVSHVGKLYNIIANRIANRIVTEIPDAAAAACTLVSRIGTRIDEPAIADVTLATILGDRLRARVEDIVRDQLSRFDALRDELVRGRTPMF
ncbi:MAG TPA: methionine adenosyltransferase [Kofleriaceae bacterium]|nr:methionine adenosyltransferase [Kofleriaceae bacterium]